MSEACSKCGYSDFDTKGNCFYCSGTIRWLKPKTILDGRYRIIKAVKAGGMGAVYKGFDERLKQICAVKEMLSDEEEEKLEYLKKRFFEEARLLADLRHNGIPRVTDYFMADGRYYLVMDYLEGVDLYFYISKTCNANGLPEKTVIEWAIEVCNILSYLHSRKPRPILHRDLKPSNIFLCNDKRLMLIDFGLARTINPDTLTEKSVVGTLGYAPMEQYQGHPEPRSDIYALGAVMHFLLTAINPAPFKFEPLKSVRPDVSDWLDNIIKKSLSIRPENRFSSALEMKNVLEKKKDAGLYKDDSGELDKIKAAIPSSKGESTVTGGFLRHRKDVSEELTFNTFFDISRETDVGKILELGEKGDPRVVEQLIEMLDSEEFCSEHRKIVHLLGNFKDERVIRPLVNVLSSPDETIRRYAPVALAKAEAKEAIGELAELLDDSSIHVRKSALKAIGKISGISHVNFLDLYLTKDKNEYKDMLPSDETLYFKTLKELVFSLAESRNSLQCYVHMAVLYEGDGKYFEAEECIKKAVYMKKNDVSILLIYLRILMAVKNYIEAEKNIKKIFKNKEPDTSLKLTYGKILLELKKYSGAIEIYDEVYLEKQDDEVENKLREVYYYYGKDLEKVGREEEALEQYEKALYLNPSYKEKDFFEALVFFKNKKQRKSLKVIENYMAENLEGQWYEEGVKLYEEIKNFSSGFVGWVKGLWD